MWSFTYPQVWFTYGHKTTDDFVIENLIKAGATGVRLTFSYGTPELQIERANQVRTIAKRVNEPIVIVADLQGEKCRFAKIEGIPEIAIERGVPFLLTAQEFDIASQPIKVPIQLPWYLDQMEPGDLVIEGDGSMLINVLERREEGVLCSKIFGDEGIHPGRGIVLQKTEFKPLAMTDKDKNDLKVIAESRMFDAVAVSFVGSATDVLDARKILDIYNSSISVIAKIETRLGIDHISEIANAADGLMAARGDLALTLPWVDLFSAVTKIANAARSTGTPWILATQLAEGVGRFTFPTRAEICDLAHWITEGAAGAMLSYETAFGPKPVDAVADVAKIVERYQTKQPC